MIFSPVTFRLLKAYYKLMSDAEEGLDQSMVASCGLCCLDCHGHTGRIADLARDLRKELRAYKYDKFAKFVSEKGFMKALGNYDECYAALGDMVKFRCKKGCQNGGGPPFCKIRKCCQDKEIEGCWECEDFGSCEKLTFLVDVHGDAHIKNLRRIRKKGIDGFLAGKRDW